MKKQKTKWILFWVVVSAFAYLVHHYGEIK